ncbi:MAG TPA: M48 family metallopeptidase [Armatimonadota bacterium]|nr:M48 family metallopeptidase [Armatimonadota bacterium]HOS42146.1 M48 family metallopeptidase [Armatimonadota bacterium]
MALDNPRQIDPSGAYTPPPPAAQWIFEDQISANRAGTIWLMFFFSLFIVAAVWAAGYALGSPEYAIILAIAAAVVAFVLSYASYYNSDKLVLSLSRARPVTQEEYPFLVHTLEGLCLAAGLYTIPKLYIIEDSAPNAFATGRDPAHSAIAVTTGLVEKLDRYQLEGVLAHELSHVVNRDILLSTVAAVLVGMIVLLSDWVMRSLLYGGRRRGGSREGGHPILLLIALLALFLSPIIAQVMRLAVSRTREYLADAHAIKLTRYPDGLAGALAVIGGDREPLEVANKATAHLYFANPLKGGSLNNLFSTHPPIEERIQRLLRM